MSESYSEQVSGHCELSKAALNLAALNLKEAVFCS